MANIRKLALFRQANWKVTVTLGKRNGTVEIVLIEPGDTLQRNYGLAFDSGTTTISGELINLNTKEILSIKATYNRQTNFGSDIISRIIYFNWCKIDSFILRCLYDVWRDCLSNDLL